MLFIEPTFPFSNGSKKINKKDHFPLEFSSVTLSLPFVRPFLEIRGEKFYFSRALFLSVSRHILWHSFKEYSGNIYRHHNEAIISSVNVVIFL